jgi:hypothetical protein
VVDWKTLEEMLAAACVGSPDDAPAERAVRAAELVAATAARLNDLRYWLGDIAAA